VKVDAPLAAGAAAVLTLAVTYLAFGGKFPFTRTPVRFLLACVLAFVIGYAVLTVVATQR
jgi:hypothetical protein